jgi:hypothetical protein
MAMSSLREQGHRLTALASIGPCGKEVTPRATRFTQPSFRGSRKDKEIYKIILNL